VSDLSRRISHLSAIQLAFAAQQIEANSELMRAEQVKRAEPVAITGMACRFPGGADDPDAFWRLLKSGGDAISEVPGDRWDIAAFYDPNPNAPGKMCCRYGGFLERVDLFDADFFGISPREAVSMDPQQRLLLEVSWEALEHANQQREQLFGSSTGVFVGISTSDYASIRAALRDRKAIDAYYMSGATLSVAAGRLSYLLGVTGPCMSIDTACSSSLVSIHLACQSLRNRESRLALAAGVGLILSPEPSINFSKAGMLARDGRCKTFDAAADGYVRGEGCGVVVLKRLSDALADGDRVLAIIRGSAINQDGSSGGLTVPSGPSQEAVIRMALAGAGLEPLQISYVEAHGTGTPLGDPIEINALAAALCKERAWDHPLIVGSVKTNIGHLEAASGIAGVIKVVLSLLHREIPAHLHFRTPNPHIDWKNMPIDVATQGRPWLPAEGRRIAGVSAFSFSGTNAHIVLEEAPEMEGRPVGRPSKDGDISCVEATGRLPLLADRYKRRERFWVDTTGDPGKPDGISCGGATGRSSQDCLPHTLLGKRLNLPMSREIRFETVFRRNFPAFLEDHQLFGTVVVAGATYLAMILQAIKESFHLKAAVLENVLMEQAITIGEGDTLLVQMLIVPESEGLFSFHIMSRDGSGADGFAGSSFVRSYKEGEEVEGRPAGHLNIYDCNVSGKIRIPEEILIAPMADASLRREEAQTKWEEIDASAFYAEISRAGHHLGDSFRWIRNIWRQGREAFCLLEVPVTICRHSDTPVSYESHQMKHQDIPSGFLQNVPSGYPGLIDSCFQFFCIWGQRLWAAGSSDHQMENRMLYSPLDEDKISSNFWSEDQNATYIPFSLGEMQFFAQEIFWPESGGRLWCHSTITAIDPLTKGMSGDITLFDERGRTLLKISGLNARKLTSDLLLNHRKEQQDVPSDFLPKESREEWLYRVNWLPIGHPVRHPEMQSGNAAPGRWLIFSDNGGVGDTIGGLLQKEGESAMLIFPGPEYNQKDRGDRPVALTGGRPAGRPYLINPGEPADFIRLVDEYCNNNHPCKGIIHLWSLDTGDGMSQGFLEKAEALACGSILYLVQALAGNKAEVQPRLWLVTNGAQSAACSNCLPPVTSLEPGLCSHQSLIWGLGNVIRMEHPEWKCSCIDIDLTDDRQQMTDDRWRPSAFSYQTTLLFESILWADMEDRIMIRDHSRYGARIMPLLLPYKGRLTLLPDATYLITGGLGALGLETARWLVEKGAANLVLVGRNEGSAAAEEQVRKLRQLGVRVEVLKADVAKRTDVARLCGGATGRSPLLSGMPPLKGIIHAAGVLSDGVLMKQDMGRFHKVISPKADGAWNLHEATLSMNLDFFVCFSSVASVLGSAGQSNYAAANAFLNGFMYERRRQGLHGLSVNWGPWELGMAAGLENRDAERIAARGIKAISPVEGFDILEQLILHDETEASVLPVSWDKYLSYHYQGMTPPFFQAVTEESSGKRSASEEKSAIIGKLEEMPAGQRRTALIDYVQMQVAIVLHLKQAKRISPDQGLFDLGIDSLMAMELKNKFEMDMGRPLRPTLVFDYPTVDKIAGYLFEEIGMADDQGRQTTLEPHKDKGSGAVVVLSAEEINDSIANELAKLESLLKG